MNLSNNKRNIIIVFGILILILIVSILSYTYAYFAFSATNTDKITGNAGTAKLELTVEKVVPTSENSGLKLIPLQDAALSNAIAGTGGKSSCIDANGNLSCQIYKVTIENSGTVNLVIRGTITLTVTGTNNIFENLKWQRLETATTVKSGTTINTMVESTLVDNDSITINNTKIYYFALWISEINEDQSEKDYGDFQGTVTFTDNAGTGVTATFTS